MRADFAMADSPGTSMTSDSGTSMSGGLVTAKVGDIAGDSKDF